MSQLHQIGKSMHSYIYLLHYDFHMWHGMSVVWSICSPGELLAPDTDRLLLGYCQQVAFGMHYFAMKGFAHRDLAARNILVTRDNVLKVSSHIPSSTVMLPMHLHFEIHVVLAMKINKCYCIIVHTFNCLPCEI